LKYYLITYQYRDKSYGQWQTLNGAFYGSPSQWLLQNPRDGTKEYTSEYVLLFAMEITPKEYEFLVEQSSIEIFEFEA
jgi:hypothetical protein